MGPHRFGRRAGRSDQRAGARLPLFRSVARRSRRRRGRHADAARRSLAIGAPRAGRCACREPRRAAGDHFCARCRSAEHCRAGTGAVAAVRRCRSGRGGGDRRRRRSRPRWRAARRCRARSLPPSPKSAPRKPAWCWSKITQPTSRCPRPIASSSASVISRRSASHCWRATILPRRRAKLLSPNCRRRSPALSPGAPGSTSITPSASRARPARRRRSPSPPTARRRKSARSSAICA